MICSASHLAAARRRSIIIASATLAATVACSPGSGAEAPLPEAAGADGRLFTRLPESVTGVRFENRLVESSRLNVFTYRNFYNGGGVGIGDLSGDGLPDLVLTSNQEGPRLYLNRGDFRFRDVTKDARVEAGDGSWSTGVSIADVNGDGRLDFYVCRAGPGDPKSRANALWMNEGNDADGVPRFVDRAAQLGLADEGYGTHAAFLDYDRDGDLDLFLINNSPRPVSSFGQRNTRHVRHRWGGHKLYRNDGGRFADVSATAGIHGSEIGFGLGLAVTDANRDGWPDVYVSNDFFERDYLFLNKGDGTFSESLDQQTSAVTYFSMGLDAADVDNDGWPEIYTTDMLPEDDYRLKLTAMYEGWDVYQAKVRNGYHHQSMRNMLQRNNRDGTFSDVGQMAGVAQTDWTWGALLADLDLDGLKDIYVTNGIARDITSQDYVAYLANDATMSEATRGGRARVDFGRLTEAMDSTLLPNYAFRNTGSLRFANEARRWGLDTPSFSSGAAYGDLDGDGALDLVVNNVNGEAFVYRNDARRVAPERRFLQVQLHGGGLNRSGIGARVSVQVQGSTMVQEQAPARGFQSSVDHVLTFGLGGRDTVDSLIVEWPDGSRSVQPAVAANQRVTVRQRDAVPGERRPAHVLPPPGERGVFAAVADSTVVGVQHRENEFVDFDRERLIPRMLSREGPATAAADVNGDGLDDLFIGGAKEQPGSLLLQQASGRFVPASAAVFEADALAEDVGALFFDATGDGRPDLYVTSGGNEFSEGATALQDRLYVNQGGGRFRRSREALPEESESGSRPAAADFDGDGDLDLFVGGRAVPWAYGRDPRSMLLRNEGRGRFTDATADVAPALARIGMVTDVVWRDVDGDARPDLVLVGEWMPITIFRNTGRRLEPMTVPGLAHSHGWWNRIVAADFNGDGATDFAIGNLGTNTRLRASLREPATLHVKDFDGNGFIEQVLATYVQGKAHPLAMRDDIIRSIPPLKARFLKYGDYAGKTLDEVFPPGELAGATKKTVHTFESAVALNDGHGNFTLHPLPAEAQIAPAYGLLPGDFDADGKLDLLVAGNFDGFKPEIGRASAGRGLLLRGDGAGAFTPVPGDTSGFVAPGEARDIVRLHTRSGALYVVARNSDRPLLFRSRPPGARTIATRNPAGKGRP